MAILVLIGVLAGVFFFRTGSYWRWIAYALVIGTLLHVFFYADGTLAKPAGDGFITYWLRAATNDGPGMGLYGLFVIFLGWGSLLYCALRAWRAASDVRKGRAQSQPASLARRIGEFVGLSFVLIASSFVSFVSPFNPESVLVSLGLATSRDARATEAGEVETALKPQPRRLMRVFREMLMTQLFCRVYP